MNILLVTIEAGGNVPPVLNLTRRLSERGHQVRFLSEPCLKHLAENAGAQFISFKEYFTKTDRKVDLFEDWKSKKNGFEKVIFGPADIVAHETLEQLKAEKTDALIVDVVLPGGLIAGEAMGVPSVMLFHMPEYLPGPNRPPGGLGLTPGRGPIGRLRDRLLEKVFHKIFNKYLPKFNDIRRQMSLEPLANIADLFHRADLRIIQTSAIFDFPIRPLPSNVRYTGAVLDDPDWVQPWENMWSANDKRPLVVVSLSTTFQNQKKQIANCIKALGNMDVRGLVTLGLAMEKEEFEIPANIKVIANASHSQIFPHADCIITHAGHGTVMRALANGVPLLCLPMGRDQGDNAAKVEYHKVGLSISSKSAPEAIRKATAKILANDEFKQNAKKLGEAIVADAKTSEIVAEIEKLAPSVIAPYTRLVGME